MRIGLDVGGTHTDAVLISREGIVSSAKVQTDHNDLLNSILQALGDILRNADARQIEAVTLSTTLTTNALLEGKADRVGVIVSSGPGIDAVAHRIGDAYHVIDGSIDHRGEERRPLDIKQLGDAIADCRRLGIRSYAVATKFSVRNPAHELLMESCIGADSDVITAGHRISGSLNFPRRITTAYFNSAVRLRYNEFTAAVWNGISELGLIAPVNILKADGGTMPLDASRLMPFQSILSGPAASIMGASALCRVDRDAVLLDIGGTSTDIAVLAAGVPLIEREGISLNGRPTLVRSLETLSIAIGGDSALRIVDGKVTVGPDRLGPCMAAGGSTPALLDALNVAGEAAYGDVEASRLGMSRLSEKAGKHAGAIANEAIDLAVLTITSAIRSLTEEVNARPVYTIHELLHAGRIDPARLIIIGGPADAFAKALSHSLGVEAIVPGRHGIANAIGAALTRTTMEIELFADTQREVLLVPALSMQERISRGYSLDNAKLDAEKYLLMSAGAADPGDVQTIEASAFNMIQGGRLVGKNIRVRSQLKPGLVPEYTGSAGFRC